MAPVVTTNTQLISISCTCVSIAMQVSCQFLAVALQQAGGVLDKGRTTRPGVLQVIWLMTDYHDIVKQGHHDKIKEEAKTLKTLSDEVLIFGHGEGTHHKANETNYLKEIVSQPNNCFYDKEETTLPWQFKDPESKWTPVTCCPFLSIYVFFSQNVANFIDFVCL